MKMHTPLAPLARLSPSPGRACPRAHREGFTLIEMLMGASIMAVVSAALVGAVVGQLTLNMTARNLSAAMTDATQVMEEIRRQNSGGTCVANKPSIKPPDPSTSWDAWLAAKGRSFQISTDSPLELVAVTCQDGSTVPPLGYCGTVKLDNSHPAQVGSGEWAKVASNTGYNPLRVTVAVGWRQGGRVVGSQDFKYLVQAPGQLAVQDDGDGVVTSQAMLTTLITCRE